MDSFAAALNQILVEAYHNILRLEEQALKNTHGIRLSIREMHLIECVGESPAGGLSVGELAARLGVSRPSATVAVNKLVRLGCLEKTACESDGRVVRLFLTREGERIDAAHRYYHRLMVRAVSEGFTEAERRCLLTAMGKLNGFFKKSIGEQA